MQHGQPVCLQSKGCPDLSRLGVALDQRHSRRHPAEQQARDQPDDPGSSDNDLVHPASLGCSLGDRGRPAPARNFVGPPFGHAIQTSVFR